MASVETTRVATERGSVRRADGRAAGRGDQARGRDNSRRHEQHGASHARVQSRRWPGPPATQAPARRDAERARSGRRHLEGDAVSAWGFYQTRMPTAIDVVRTSMTQFRRGGFYQTRMPTAIDVVRTSMTQFRRGGFYQTRMPTAIDVVRTSMTQFRRGGFYQTRMPTAIDVVRTSMTQFRRGGFYQTRCRIHVHERCPAERASGWA